MLRVNAGRKPAVSANEPGPGYSLVGAVEAFELSMILNALEKTDSNNTHAALAWSHPPDSFLLQF